MIDALGLTGATLVSSAVGLAVALLPVIGERKGCVIIGAIVAVVATSFGFVKLRDYLEMNSVFDFLKLAVGFVDVIIYRKYLHCVGKRDRTWCGF